MASFPVIPSDPSFSNIFSGVSYYQVLTWSGTSYITPTAAEAGRGYWALVLQTVDVGLCGTPVTSYELDLPAGWSMIGSIYGSTVDPETVFPGYYQLLTWSGTSYIDAKLAGLESGKGYWALVLVNTHIRMPPSGGQGAVVEVALAENLRRDVTSTSTLYKVRAKKYESARAVVIF
jgi:hypothetical protein